MTAGRTRLPLVIVLLLCLAGGLAYYFKNSKFGTASLVNALKDPEASVRREAAEALLGMGADGVPALVGALSDDEVRPRAINILHQIGPPAHEATSALIDIVREGNGADRAQAITALGRIGAAESAAPIVEALQDEESAIRAASVIALGRLGPVDETVVPALVGVLQDGALRPSALSALGRCGAGAKDAVPALIELFGQIEADADLARVALTLDQIGPEAEAAVPTLVEALGHSSHLVGAGAASALGSIGPAARDAVPALMEAVRSPAAPVDSEDGFGGDVALARSATAALGKIGPDAKEALPVLREALDHGDEDVREYAGIAIRRIEGVTSEASEETPVADE